MTYGPFICDTLAEAARLARHLFGHVSGTIKPEDPNQVLTEADLAVGRFLVDAIQARFPEHNVIDEESGVVNRGSSSTWVIDPVDGTANFAHGVPDYGIFVGLLHQDRAVAGGIALPAEGRILVAERGAGAFDGTTRLRVDPAVRLEDALVAVGIDGHRDAPRRTRRDASLLAELALRCRGVRSSNSATDWVRVADGRYAACLFPTGKVWDCVGPQVVLEEAGAKVTSVLGQPLAYRGVLGRTHENFSTCAAPPAIHAAVRDIAREVATAWGSAGW
jgi:myo-inositol-1(or 4)-monophosphatase